MCIPRQTCGPNCFAVRPASIFGYNICLIHNVEKSHVKGNEWRFVYGPFVCLVTPTLGQEAVRLEPVIRMSTEDLTIINRNHSLGGICTRKELYVGTPEYDPA
jgi:hypothetical protein